MASLVAWIAMMNWIALVGLCGGLLSPWSATAAEKVFDLTQVKPDQLPGGFRSALAGAGQPGEWKVLLDEVPLTFEPLTTEAVKTRKLPVLAQLSTDPTDERFPLLIYDDEVFGDFTLTVRFKTVRGLAEQMAGVAFRLQDERNFYVVRANSREGTFRFYRMFNGNRDPAQGPEMTISAGVWHELKIEARGNRFRIWLDGQEPIPEITDSTFTDGKIALWTKSDAVSYFRDLRLTYTPRESLAAVLVRDTLRRYPRLLGVRIISTTSKRKEWHVVASGNPAELGQPGNPFERECVEKDTIMYGKGDQKVIVTLPLHDRNGEPIAAVRFEMRSFAGQTEQNAVARATPIMRGMAPRVTSLKDLTE